MKEIAWVIIHFMLAIYCQKEYERTDKAYFLVLFILNCVMMAVQTVLFFI